MVCKKQFRTFNVVWIFIATFINGLDSQIQTQTECPVDTVSSKWGPYLQQLTGPFDHGEEPTWDPRTQLLYFVDLHRGIVNSFNPVTNELNQVHFAGTVSPIIPTYIQQKFVVGNNRSVVTFYWDGKSSSIAENVTVLTTVDVNKPGNRFNDGKADKDGRLWWGTIGPENATGVEPNQASLYKITKENYKNPQVAIRPVTNSNGLTWTKDNKHFYYIDTPTRKIAMYDFDLESGEISNKTIVFDLDNYNISGLPDGMTIDIHGHLFIALYNGGSIIKVDPTTGSLLQQIAFPAQYVTSCMFGGKNLDILFVTTSRHGLSESELETQPSAGCLFALTGLGTRGIDTYLADI